MTIGERRIRGIIREREEARAHLRGGPPAGLRRRAADPGAAEHLHADGGEHRAGQGDRHRDQLLQHAGLRTTARTSSSSRWSSARATTRRAAPAASAPCRAAAAGVSGQATEVQYLKPGERSGHDIGRRGRASTPAMPIEQTRAARATSSTSGGAGEERATRQPAPLRHDPEQGLRAALPAGGRRPRQGACSSQRDEHGGGWFTLMLQPPAGARRRLERPPLEMVFVLDCSGSMSGWPIEKAKAALRRALKSLCARRHLPDHPLLRRQRRSSGPAPVPATPENIAARPRLPRRPARGRRHRDDAGDPRGARLPARPASACAIVSFMTDGYIGNEAQILGDRRASGSASARIFSFGVGSSVNRYLMEGLARVGRGAVAYVVAGDSDTEAVDRFFERISQPGADGHRDRLGRHARRRRLPGAHPGPLRRPAGDRDGALHRARGRRRSR